MKYRIADFNVEFKNTDVLVEDFFSDFKTENTPEVSFEITNEDIKYERDALKYPTTDKMLSVAAFQRKFIEWLPFNNSFFLHASLIDVEGEGVAFAALSGTGKTTHTLLWKQLLGDRIAIVNGDKPIIRFFDGEEYPYGYGAPWCGKEHYGTTGRVSLKHLCFIERGEKNRCEPMDSVEAIDIIFNQAYIPRNNPIAVYNTLSLVDRVLNVCSLWKITCTPDIEAAQVAYNTIFKEN